MSNTNPEDDFQTDHLEAMADEEIDLTEPSDDLTALEEERDLLKDRLMRALADAENSRKRGDRDRREAEQYGGTKLARDLLSVYDNLRRAVDMADDAQKEAAKAVFDGIERTLREFISTFGRHGIDRIVPEVGDKFDPQFHQAMFEAPLPDTKAGEIIQVMSEGFTIHDRLLRPAQVGVSSTPG